MITEEVDLELMYYAQQIRNGIFWITKEEQDELLLQVNSVDKSKLNQSCLKLLTNIFHWDITV